MSNVVYNESNGHYIIKDARIQWPNFEGREENFNAAGKRNFRLLIPEELYNELNDRGVYTRARPPRDETEETQYYVKVGVYPSSDVRIYSGKALNQLVADSDPERDQYKLVDAEYRKGHVEKADVEFHVSVNTKVPNSAPYVRLDTAIITVGRSQLLDDYEEDPFEGE